MASDEHAYSQRASKVWLVTGHSPPVLLFAISLHSNLCYRFVKSTLVAREKRKAARFRRPVQRAVETGEGYCIAERGLEGVGSSQMERVKRAQSVCLCQFARLPYQRFVNR